MKNKIILIFTIVIICAAAYIFTYESAPVLEESVSADAQLNGTITFAVLGDVHSDAVKLQEDIRDLHRLKPDMDALVLNGDTADEGLENDYNAIKKVLNLNSQLIPKNVIKNIGNHEFFDYKKEYNTPEDVAVFINRYLEFAGEKTVYHDTWIKDYHFISLGSENGNTKDFNSVKAFISDKQLQWLKEKLAEGYEKGKPIFVFLHQPINSAARGWVGTDQSEDIKKILSDYPEIVLFSSHTHAALEADTVKLDQPFTMVHTGAVHYTLVSDGKGGRQQADENMGVVITVQGNKVTVRGRNFKTKSWIFSKDINN